MQLPVATQAHTPLESRIADVRKRIRLAAEKANRDPSSVLLIASTRTLMVDPVLEAARAGLADFSEEYLPEGVTKRPYVDRMVPGLSWHFTGSLPSTKLRLAIENFDWLHTVDRISLMKAFSQALAQTHRERELKVLLEVNPLGIKKRLGIEPKELPEMIAQITQLPGCSLRGLSFKSEMSLLPTDLTEGFEKMKILLSELLQKGILPDHSKELAMGTSRNFEEAIAKGATMVRVGTGLFPETQV